MIVLSPFYKHRDRLNNLPRVTQLVNVEPWFESDLFGFTFSTLNCEHCFADSQLALEILLLNLKSLEDDSLNTNKSLEGEWYKYDGALLLVSLFHGLLTLEEVKCMCLRQSKEEVHMVKDWGLSKPFESAKKWISNDSHPLSAFWWDHLTPIHERLWARGTQLSCSPVPHLNKQWYNKYFIFL